VVLAAACLFTGTLYYAQEPPPVEQPPGLIELPMGARYIFENGMKWGKPQIGYCCRSKWDFAQEHERLPNQVTEYLRVYGQEGDVVTVTQLDGQNMYFFLSPVGGPPQTQNVVTHTPEEAEPYPELGLIYARFACTGGDYGFAEKPLHIKVVRTTGAIDDLDVEAGGTFGIRARRDPANWGFGGGWSDSQIFEVQADFDGSLNTITPDFGAGGYDKVAVRTRPADVDTATTYFTDDKVKVSVFWQMDMGFTLYMQYMTATDDVSSSVSVSTVLEFNSDFPGFPAAATDTKRPYSESRIGGTFGHPLVESPWIADADLPDEWFGVQPTESAMWKLTEHNEFHKAVIDDTDDSPLKLEAQGIWPLVPKEYKLIAQFVKTLPMPFGHIMKALLQSHPKFRPVWRSWLKFYVEGLLIDKTPVEPRLWVEYPF
jgi:hypothetical protein